jgi:predicted O-linked N-acetylglucosamine transferase (SPINDLY family)
MNPSGKIDFERPTVHHGSMIAVDREKRFFMKIQLLRDADKNHDVPQEAEIIRRLNAAGCLTCPQLEHSGAMSRAEVESLAGGGLYVNDSRLNDDICPFIIMQYLPEATRVRLADLLLALIEQKSLGVYHGDVRPENCRFDPTRSILYLVDYDQAEILDDVTQAMGNLDFLRWCDDRARERFGFDSMFHYFPGLEFTRDVAPLFRDGALNLAHTSLFRDQQTTLSQGGIYHSIAEAAVFADGERDLTRRKPLLDAIAFRGGERVLDIGCNTGLLARYLHDRGCAVTGIELDSRAVDAARIIGNIGGKKIDYHCLDLDENDLPGDYDTVMLFSVLHHTRDPAANARKIAKACRRIIIECRLVETGAKPIRDVWQTTSAWRFATVDELTAFLARLFPGFRLAGNLGQGDRDRYLFELVATGADVPALVRRADAERKAGQPKAAASLYRQALAADPESFAAHRGLAHLADQDNRPAESVGHLRQAVEIRPKDSAARFAYAVALSRAGRWDDAIAQYERLLETDPAYFPALINLADAVSRAGQPLRAIALYERVLEQKPDFAEVLSNLGNIYKNLGRAEESLAHYRRAATIKPSFLPALNNLLFAAHYAPSLDAKKLFEDHVAGGRAIAGGAAVPAPPDCDRDPGRVLRIGYLSPDFRTHPVAFFIEPVLAAHDRTRFVVIAYSNTNAPDETTARIKAAVDIWRDVRPLSDAALADRIRADKVDILVELSGHTANNRLAMMARRPAPVQVTYLGYPDTTGIPAIGYRLTDRWADPPGVADALATEKLIRLPHGFLCYRPPADLPEIGPLPALAAGHVTFASFNNLAKTHGGVIETWADILHAVPGSRLRLKSRIFLDGEVRDDFHAAFADTGIDRDRVDLLGVTKTVAEHLAQYNGVDIALDTFPYNGATTSCEALIMGVPVITFAGTTHAGRVGASLLSSYGLADLIATDRDDYVARAIALAGDTVRLAALRGNLRGRVQGAPSSDPAQFTGDLEAAYREMWTAFCAADT